MSASVLNILSILLVNFRCYGDVPEEPKNPTREEKNVATRISSLIQQVVDGDIEVSEEETLALNEDEDYEDFEFDAFDGYTFPTDLQIQFGNKFTTREKVFEAIKYYRAPAKKSRSLATMNKRFRWIQTNYDLIKLRKIEEFGDDYHGDRLQRLRVLGLRLFETVKAKFDLGISLHDEDLSTIANELNKTEFKLDKFVASQSWVTRWKRKYRIVSRKVTKFTTRRCIIDKVQIAQRAQTFVSEFKKDIDNYQPEQVFNSDQTAILKELYGARSLSIMGEKIVERVIQAKASITHSFTFLPMLFLNGSMGAKAFMVLPEPTGHFPPTRPIPNPPNLVIRCGKSHIMTKDLMLEWVRECVLLRSGPKKLLMLVDSWPSFRDHKKMKECLPPGYDLEIRNIPPLCTGLIQPLDTYWNLPWKSLIKKFTSYALIHRPNYTIAQRNNLIWMTSLLYHQIGAKHFQPFMQYAWKSAGYTDSYSPFQTPSQFCFGEVKNSNCFKPNCTTSAFIKCARCKEVICFEHFIVEEQHLCNSD